MDYSFAIKNANVKYIKFMKDLKDRSRKTY